MGLLSIVVQIAGIGVAIYVAITGSFSHAVQLVLVVAIGHWLAMRVSNGLMLAHQKTLMTEEEVDAMLGGSAPKAWPAIATAVGLAYVAAVCWAIWWTLAR